MTAPDLHDPLDLDKERGFLPAVPHDPDLVVACAAALDARRAGRPALPPALQTVRKTSPTWARWVMRLVRFVCLGGDGGGWFGMEPAGAGLGSAARERPGEVTSGSGVECSVTQAREQLAELVNRAAYGRETIYLTRRGRRLAALVPVALVPVDGRAERAPAP